MSTSSKSRFKSLNEFNILEEIGKGGYSKVYLVENKKTKRRYALKACFRRKGDKDRSGRTMTEIKILKKLKHDNIMRLKGWFEDDDNIYLVLRFIPGKDCSKYCRYTGFHINGKCRHNGSRSISFCFKQRRLAPENFRKVNNKTRHSLCCPYIYGNIYNNCFIFKFNHTHKSCIYSTDSFVYLLLFICNHTKRKQDSKLQTEF